MANSNMPKMAGMPKVSVGQVGHKPMGTGQPTATAPKGKMSPQADLVNKSMGKNGGAVC